MELRQADRERRSRRDPGEDERARGGISVARRRDLRAGVDSGVRAQASGNGDASTEDEVVEDADFEVIDEEEAAKS